MLRHRIASFVTILILCLAGISRGQDSNSSPSPRLTSDLRNLGLGSGPDAVYLRETPGFSVKGYAEAVYDHFADTNNIGQPSNRDSQMGLLRGVMFLGYRFNDHLLVNSELRADKDSTINRPGKLAVESAYVDAIFSKSLIVRAGLILVPMGLYNEFHAPDEIIGTRRPLPETVTIPTTWHAVGFGIVGHKGIGDYRIYIVNGLNAAGFSINDMRGAREISLDTLRNPSLVLRLDGHLFRGFTMGGSYYLGNSGVYGTAQPVDLKIHTTNKEIHFVYERGGVRARAQYAKLLLQSTPQLNLVLGTTGYNGIGSRMVGGYAEGGYDFLHRRANGTSLMPYMRVEESNPQDAVPPGSTQIGVLKNMTVDHLVWTFGMQVAPIRHLLIKADYQRDRVEHVNYGVNQFNIGVSYIFD